MKPDCALSLAPSKRHLDLRKVRCRFVADLYGGKSWPLLDRQHRRDFLMSADLLANKGIDETLRRAFLVYLLVITEQVRSAAPRRKPIEASFAVASRV